MKHISDLLSGRVHDAAATHKYLAGELMPGAIARMNAEGIPARLRLFNNEALPTNQRNLTDFRTRLGLLLEYELARAIWEELDRNIEKSLRLMYVIANRFPDIEFRLLDGGRGVRLEIKTIDILAEEKAANFDTLIKDVRAGFDFVVVMLWRWVACEDGPSRMPEVTAVYVLDAYELAKLRDCYWLNKPPANARSARQGFDIRYAVNCSGDDYNQEEGNLGKLMRLFDVSAEGHLDDPLRKSATLRTYYEMCDEICRQGLRAVCLDLAETCCSGDGARVEIVDEGLPLCILGNDKRHRIVIVGDVGKPKAADIKSAIADTGARAAIAVNGKFSWWAYNAAAEETKQGKKPSTALNWANQLSEAAEAALVAEPSGSETTTSSVHLFED